MEYHEIIQKDRDKYTYCYKYECRCIYAKECEQSLNSDSCKKAKELMARDNPLIYFGYTR